MSFNCVLKPLGMYVIVSNKQMGYSLLELVIAIVILAFVFLIIAVAFLPQVEQSTKPLLQLRTSAIAQAYIEQILSKRFDENNGVGAVTRCNESGQPACSTVFGPESETRSQYDDVDDYHALSDQPPIDVNGTTLNQYAGYQVNVSVTYDGTTYALPSQAIKRIDVTVNGPDDYQATFSVLKGNF